MRVSDLGLIQVYTGTGKGKTTASLGLAMRACGHGLKAYMIQFMKGRIDYGELKIAEKIDGLTIEQFGRPDFVDKDNPAKEDIKLARDALARSKEVILGGKYDIVILDEVNVAIEWNLIEVGEVIDLLKKKPKEVEVVLTGRYARQEIIDLADLVSEVREVKHPFKRGMHSRIGVDY
ncbi:MAG: cob(I)yrinic acid a,c-diamide adenosyltransferase [Thermoplasmata archaeon]|nr:cob(I)yrinic acid a,c-diamide adenosyltransferase [Thermoplasmata archaeon]